MLESAKGFLVVSLAMTPVVLAFIYPLHWLKTGDLPPWTLLTFAPDFIVLVRFEWVGVSRIILRLLNLPIIFPVASLCWGTLLLWGIWRWREE
jgi:hypothetical protein